MHLLMQNFGRNMNLTSLLGYLSQIVALSLSWRVATMTFHVLGERAPWAKKKMDPFACFSPSVPKIKEAELGKSYHTIFAQGLISKAKLLPTLNSTWILRLYPPPQALKNLTFLTHLARLKKWCERVSMPKFLQCIKLTLPHEIHFLNLLQSCP